MVNIILSKLNEVTIPDLGGRVLILFFVLILIAALLLITSAALMQTNVFRCENDCRRSLKGISLLKLNQAQKKNAARDDHIVIPSEEREFPHNACTTPVPADRTHTEIKQTYPRPGARIHLPARPAQTSPHNKTKSLQQHLDGKSSWSAALQAWWCILRAHSPGFCSAPPCNPELLLLSDLPWLIVKWPPWAWRAFLYQRRRGGGCGREMGEIALNLTSLSSLLFFFSFEVNQRLRSSLDG